MSWEFGPIQLRLLSDLGSESPDSLRHVVSCTVFRSPVGYRSSTKYADGLIRLLKLLPKILPHSLLRVFCDESVLCCETQLRECRGGRGASELQCWTDVLKELKASPIVQLVEYSIPEAQTLERHMRCKVHPDMLGTLVRLIPMFCAQSASPVPSWIGPLRESGLVLCFDADFSDMTFERMTLHLTSWFVRAAEKESVEGTNLPALVAYSTSGSTAARHLPLAGLPAALAGCVASRSSFPQSWLVSFLRDGLKGSQTPERGGSSLAGRYARQLHEPQSRNFTFKRRRIGEQRSAFVFGVDEFFLSAVHRPLTMVQEEKQLWVYVVIPSVDRVVQSITRRVSSCLESDPNLLRSPTIQRLLEVGAAGAGTGALDLQKLRVEDATREMKEWAGKLASKVGLYNRFTGDFRDLMGPVAEEAMRRLEELLRLFIRAMAEATIPHSADDLDLALQHLSHISTSKGKAIACRAFRVGGGHVVEETASADAFEVGFLEELTSVGKEVSTGGSGKRMGEVEEKKEN